MLTGYHSLLALQTTSSASSSGVGMQKIASASVLKRCDNTVLIKNFHLIFVSLNAWFGVFTTD